MKSSADLRCVAPARVRDRAVLHVGGVVYVWPIPEPGRSVREVRRLRLDRPLRRLDAFPSFGGDDAPQASKQTQADRLRRLHARAALFATPETFCSTQDIADVFGLRESDVRAARPLTARRIGRACMAPFGDWLVAIGIDLDALADRTAATRAPTVRTVDTPTLRPLGGPHSARR